MISSSFDGTINFWDCFSLEYRNSVILNTGKILEILLSEYQDVLYIVSKDKVVNILEIQSIEPLQFYKFHNKPVIYTKSSPDGKYLYSSDQNGQFARWNIPGFYLESHIDMAKPVKNIIFEEAKNAFYTSSDIIH